MVIQPSTRGTVGSHNWQLCLAEKPAVQSYQVGKYSPFCVTEDHVAHILLGALIKVDRKDKGELYASEVIRAAVLWAIWTLRNERCRQGREITLQALRARVLESLRTAMSTEALRNRRAKDHGLTKLWAVWGYCPLSPGFRLRRVLLVCPRQPADVEPGGRRVEILLRPCAQVEAFRLSGRVGSVVHSFLSSPAFLDGEMRLCTSVVGTFWAGSGIRLWAEAVGGSFARTVVRVVWLICDLWVWCGRVLSAANLLGKCGGLCWIVRYLAVGDGLRREAHLQFKQPDFAASRQLIAHSTIV
ncbi:hypothetical protein CBR_g28707 [Chara braunii]|uniref:Uncharacterized protein n=1 Tax=Chara braunii TaxID=69332 RepID=A0A388L9N2_CHABU|nr:hypothetical protein CBR_g28707 [Chara braunii]|eukprot:GBG78994.1 hypothetical protein CBR_g28707 [Chara braunii]